MTIILSAAASLLVAALILTWQQSDDNAQLESIQATKQMSVLNAKIRRLEEKLRVAEADTSGRSVKDQVDFANDTTSLKHARVELAQIQDRVNAANATAKEDPDPLEEELTSSALDSALGKTSEPETMETEKDLVDAQVVYNTDSEESVSANTEQQRRQEIKAAKIYAQVVHVTKSPDGDDTIIAELTEGSHIQINAILAIRRHDIGIAGRVRIVSTQVNGTKEILILETVSRGVGLEPVSVITGDELILEPQWSYSKP